MTGSLLWQPSTVFDKQLVYSIRCKPPECCATLVSTEGNDVNLEKPDPVNGKSTITIYNGHCHPNRGSTSECEKSRRKIVIFFIFVYPVFVFLMMIGAFLASSFVFAAVTIDLSFTVLLSATWCASRPQSRWRRARVLTMLAGVLLLWVVIGLLMYTAIVYISTSESRDINATLMVIPLAIALCINIVTDLTLNQYSQYRGAHASHSHEASDLSSANINVRVAYLRVLSCFMLSLSVLVTTLVVYFRPNWEILDPICTLLLPIFELTNTYIIIRVTMAVLREDMPKEVNFVDVLETFMKIEGVVRVPNLRTWALSPDSTIMTAHLAVRPDVNTTTVVKEASRRLQNKYNLCDWTLQVVEFDRCSNGELSLMTATRALMITWLPVRAPSSTSHDP